MGKPCYLPLTFSPPLIPPRTPWLSALLITLIMTNGPRTPTTGWMTLLHPQTAAAPGCDCPGDSRHSPDRAWQCHGGLGDRVRGQADRQRHLVSQPSGSTLSCLGTAHLVYIHIQQNHWSFGDAACRILALSHPSQHSASILLLATISATAPAGVQLVWCQNYSRPVGPGWPAPWPGAWLCC